MHFKVTSFHPIGGQILKLCGSEGVRRSFSLPSKLVGIFITEPIDTPTHNFGLKSNQQSVVLRILSFFEIQIPYFHVGIKSLFPMRKSTFKNISFLGVFTVKQRNVWKSFLHLAIERLNMPEFSKLHQSRKGGISPPIGGMGNFGEGRGFFIGW